MRFAAGSVWTAYRRCGHCKTLKPEFAKVSEDDSVSAKMVAIDCTGNPETCQKFKATSYPTVHWFQDGADSKGRSFDGGRTAKAMAKWIKTAVDPSYKDPSLGPFVNQPLWKDERCAAPSDHLMTTSLPQPHAQPAPKPRCSTETHVFAHTNGLSVLRWRQPRGRQDCPPRRRTLRELSGRPPRHDHDVLRTL